MNHGKVLLLALCVLCLLSFALGGLLYPAARPAQAAPQPLEKWIVETIPQGGSIFSVLEKHKLPLDEIGTVSYYFGNYIDVTTIQPGDTLKLQFSQQGRKLAKLEFIQEPTARHYFTAQGDSLAYELVELPVQLRARLLNGRLEGTLDASLLSSGLSAEEKQQINNGLEADINFSRDARNGDAFQVLLQERFFDGEKLPGGKILYVSYTGENTGRHELFRYEDAAEKSVLSGLYTVQGKSNSTSGVGFPLASIHVVSAFGNRVDPYYRGWAFHQGVDYRAGWGTPVYAVANGTVLGAGYSGGWGNEVRIRHSSGLVSQYAHLSSMSVRRGQSVVRGQVIGRVGSTGRSTGAHLHFGLLNGGSYINPNQLRMVGAEKLEPARMADFQAQMRKIRARVDALSATS